MQIEMIDDVSDVNACYQREFEPFFELDNFVHVDKVWHDNFEAFRNLVDSLDKVKIYPFEYPHEVQERCSKLAFAFDELFFVDSYHEHLNREIIFVDIDKRSFEILSEACRVHQMGGTGKVHVEDLNPVFVSRAAEACQVLDGAFCRTSRCSFKVPGENVSRYRDIDSLMNDLTKSDRVFKDFQNSNRYENRIYRLAFTKWLTFPPQFEFRVFVHEKRIVGISQQNWYEKYDWREIKVNFEKLIETASDFVKRSGYSYCTLDAFCSESEAIIIEANPPSIGFGSGSALFNWKRDFPLTKSQEVVIRLR